jgi:NOL1/NOP2/fmu family ribosome biogenesis protein
MFRKEESAVTEWSEDNVRMCAERQKGILDNAARLVRSDGYIVYATCTFSLEENEMVVDDFLRRHPDFEIVKVTPAVEASTADGISFSGCETENISYARRFYPHLGKGEGQFMAVLKNTLESEKRELPAAPKQKIDKSVFEFLDVTLESYDKNAVREYNGNPVFFAPSIEIKKGTAFSCGVLIGEVKKNYIMPHHQFFMAMGASFIRKIPVHRDSETLTRYLRGEEIPCECENGWAVVTVDGCTVGGVKAVSGVAKNHYPKGLRLH